MDSTSASHFKFAASVVGFVMAVTSAAAWCYACFPSIQMKVLDDLLRETRQIYEQADGENIFSSEQSREISIELVSMEQRSVQLREDTYKATTVIHEFYALFNGLSLRIIRLSYGVKNLRARLHTAICSFAPSDNWSAADTSVLSLTTIDAFPDLESAHTSLSSQQFDGSSDPRQRQSASWHTAPSEVSEVLVGLGDSHHQGNVTLASEGAPLSASEGIPPLFTVVSASPPNLLRRLRQLWEWMSTPHVPDIPEISDPSGDIVILPRYPSPTYPSFNY